MRNEDDINGVILCCRLRYGLSNAFSGICNLKPGAILSRRLRYGLSNALRTPAFHMFFAIPPKMCLCVRASLEPSGNAGGRKTEIRSTGTGLQCPGTTMASFANEFLKRSADVRNPQRPSGASDRCYLNCPPFWSGKTIRIFSSHTN